MALSKFTKLQISICEPSGRHLALILIRYNGLKPPKKGEVDLYCCFINDSIFNQSEIMHTGFETQDPVLFSVVVPTTNSVPCSGVALDCLSPQFKGYGLRPQP